MKNCIVIGGGAAGMMAAIAAAEAGATVTLLEKNEKCGKKVYITGKGRCNVTNDCEAEQFFSQVVSNPKFLYSAYYNFNQSRVIQLIEENGCLLKVERGNRVFPVSDHSSDIIKALRKAMDKGKVTVLFHKNVTEIVTKDGMAVGVLCEDGKKLYGDAVIVCTGGVSYPSTGSTGDGYRFAKKAGHSIIEEKPALVPLTVQEEWPLRLQGLALKNVEIRLLDGKKTIYSGFGEMLFTHFGISGPLILTASSYYVKKARGKKLPLYLDLKPALSFEQLDARLLRDFTGRQNKQFKNALEGLFPSRLAPVMIRLSNIEPDTMIHDLTREERQSFVNLIKNLPLTVTGTRDFQEAIITQGGVNVKEINPSTMESKKLPHLYFAGEVLDLDALTGGFNLQIAFSTGYLAGQSAAESDSFL